MERKMKKLIAICLPVIALFALNAHSQMEEPLKLIQTIPLPGLHDGDFDHFALDLSGQRLFLAAEDNSAVEVLDLRTNKMVHTINGPKTPHSLAYNPDSKKLFVVDGDPSQVEIYDGTTFRSLGAIPMAANADASIYDPAGKLLYVGNGGKEAKEDYCLLSVIDTTTGEKLGDIKVNSDRVEAMALEKSGTRMFVNMYSKNAVAVIDREKRTQIATWSVADEGRRNGQMAFDEANHRLFVVTRDPAKVVVLDSDSGKIVTSVPCVGQFDSDDAVYDAGSKRLYVAGTPFLEIFNQRSANSYQLLGQVPAAFHAKTAILVPQLNRYYLAVNHHGDTAAKVQVYEVVP
jgi:DNA-binding beta-propeller fold protein YncE